MTGPEENPRDASKLTTEEKKQIAVEAVKQLPDTDALGVASSPYAWDMSEADIDEEIANITTQQNKLAARTRMYYWICLAVVIIGILLTTIVIVWKSGPMLWITPGVLVAVGGLLWATVLFLRNTNYQINARTEIQVLAARKKTLRRLTPSSTDSSTDTSADSYFDSLVQINVDNLGAYYIQVKAHTNKSFQASLGVGLLGFLLIVAGLGMGFLLDRSDLILTYIATASGIVVEFIAGVFFYLYNRTVRQMKGYHDSLLTIQNVLLAFKLVGDIKTEEVKSKMVGQMLAYLVDRQPKSSEDTDRLLSKLTKDN